MFHVAVLAASVLLQLAAAVLALRLIRVTGKTVAWIAIATAVLLMAVRRASTLVTVLTSPDAVSGASHSAELIALSISILLVFGLAAIGPLFDRIRRTEESELSLGRVIESSLNEVYIVNASDLRLVRVNLGAKKNLGYRDDELAKLTLPDLSTDFDEPRLRHSLDPFRSGQLSRLVFEARFRRKNDTDYPVEVDIQATNFEGRPAFVAVVHDTTKREEALAEKQQAEALLHHAQRMETVGNLAGGVAHDFNNLLTPIMGYATLLTEELADRPEAREDAAEILKAAGQAQALVRQLLVFSRRAEPERSPVVVKEVVQDVMGLVRLAAPNSIKLKQHLEAEDVAMADSTQLHQVVMNLCTNAIDAMREQGGELTVTLTRTGECPASYGEDRPPKIGSYLRLSVADTGAGMDQEVMDRLFDPFFTTKVVGEGTGLGLSVVQAIAFNHDWAITVFSAPGCGSVFNVFIPTLEQPVTEVPNRPPVATLGKEHLLVIDDEEAVGRVTKRILEHKGYRVDLVTKPLEAIERVRTDSTVDMVITDLDMPELSGLDLTERLRLVHPDLPVILVSGYSDALSKRRMEEVGITAKVNKPFSGSDLTRVVREALDGVKHLK